MKRFSFSLQKILDLRLFAEEQAKIALAQAISHADKIKADLLNIAEKRVASNSQRSVCTAFTDHIAIENYIVRLDLKKEELLEELAAAELVIEERRAVMNEAMKQRKVLSNLREKKYAEYRKMQNQASDVELDDMTQPLYAASSAASLG